MTPEALALANIDRRIVHNGNSSGTVFAYGFPILDVSHLSVIYTDADAVETTLSPSDYIVTGIGARTGGNVTYPLPGSPGGSPAGPPIGTGTKLTIVRTVPLAQTKSLSNQGDYFPEIIEARFDQIYIALQQLGEAGDRDLARNSTT